MPELISGGTMVPMMRRLERIEEASWLRMKPSRSITAITRARVSGSTLSGSVSTRDTVIGATPARRAISFMPRRGRSVFGPAASDVVICRPPGREACAGRSPL